METTPNFPPAEHSPGARVAIGATIAGRYAILDVLGRGGFASVYRAHDHVLGESVALKVFELPQDASATLDALRQEVRMARRIRHRNVIDLYDLGTEQALGYLSMEWLDGESLRERIARTGALGASEALRIFVAAARGVGAAHARGVVHRDLKPGNVLVGRDGTVKVLDFGLATLSGGRGPGQHGSLVGTPAYVAPEQVEGERASPSADLYSLGVMLFEMLTGELPFRGENALATALARLSERPQDPCIRNPAVPGWLGRIVLRCLEREPADRYPTVERLLQDISSAAREADRATTHTLALPPSITRFRSLRLVRRYAPLALVALGALVTLPTLRRSALTEDARRAFADGVVRIAVADLEEITADPETRLVASGLAEALRTRLSEMEGIRVVGPPGLGRDTPAELLDALGVEQLMGGSVGRLGGRLRVVVSVSALPGHERWMTFERSLDWQDTWEQVDGLAAEFLSAYSERLSRARRAAA